MNLHMRHDQLVEAIQRFARDARERRQVYKRLHQLLPDRLKALVLEQRSRFSSSSHSHREALVSNFFVAQVDEVVEIGALCHESRIQYETHLMLIDARRSLKKFR